MAMKPIRILNVVGRMDRGGIETFIMNVYRNIDRERVQFDFLAHYGKEDAHYNDEIKKLGGKIYEMPVIKTTEKTYYSKVFEYRNALKYFFKQHDEYKILHGHMTNTASIYMPIAKKYGSVKVCIAHSHLSRRRHGLNGILTDVLKIPLRKYATDYFACSIEAAKWLFRDHDIRNGRVKVINNAIDSQLYIYDKNRRDDIRKLFGITDELVIGHIGRFFHEKNHEFLIDVFFEILNSGINAKLMLAGEGLLKPLIESKVKRLGIQDKVIFLGVRDDIPDILQAMDIFVLPSIHEGLPVVSIEAQASGLPCVLSTGVTSEADISGLVSFVSLKTDVKVWAESIINIFGSTKRANTQSLIIENGYDIHKIANELQTFYEQAYIR